MLPIHPTRPARTVLVALLVLLGCAASGVALTAAPASATSSGAAPLGAVTDLAAPVGAVATGVFAAQATVPPTTTAPGDDGPSPVPRIIPLPNSGQAPNDPGDRGGWLQVSLFWFLLGALGLMGLLIWRDGHRKKRKAAAARAARAATSAGTRAPAPAGGTGTGGRAGSQHG